jgi:dinuclear metal center YbgI/SA1388 family protein
MVSVVSQSPLVADLVSFLQKLAPPALAEEWDNVGLLVGDRSRPVSRILTCLTLTPDVADEAIAERAALIVTHHPVLFRPVKRLTADDSQGKMLLSLIEAGIAVYSPHTGYDSAAAGINQQLAERLDLSEIQPLKPISTPPTCKVVCFVPREHLVRVQEAVWEGGAGEIGAYSRCSFVMDGTGTFFGGAESKPAIGEAGRLEQVAEARLEVDCPERLVPEVVRRLRKAHPYEEPAYDVYPLRAERTSLGAGRWGRFRGTGAVSGDGTLAELVEMIKSRLGVSTLQVVGDLAGRVARVGICCGSGGELLSAAIAAGCDAFFTGEARFHNCLEARSAGISLILAGHYATERPAMELLAAILQQEFSGVTAWASRVERDPVQWM